MAANPQSAEYDQQQQNQRFWQGIAKLPESAGRSFWDAGQALSGYLGEPPVPRRLTFDTAPAPAGMPWWEKIFYYIGQGQYNQAVAQQAAGKQMAAGAQWLWAALQGDFNRSPTTGQMIVGGVISMIPIVDQACDVRDIIANCIVLSDEKERENGENWIALGLTCFGFVPEIGSAVKTVAKTALKNAQKLLDVLKVMEHLEANFAKLGVRIPWGRAPIEWLRKFDWEAAARAAADGAKKAFQKAKELAVTALRYAAGAIQCQLDNLVKTFSAISAKIGEAISTAAKKIKEKIGQFLKREKEEAGNYGGAPGGPNRHRQNESPIADSHKAPGQVLKSMSKEDLAEWYKKQHPMFENADVLKGHMSGTDFSKPVLLKELPEGTEVIQYVRKDGQPGMYFAYPGTKPEDLAIMAEGRELKSFTLNQPLQVIESTAAQFPSGKIPGVGGPGGGQQVMFPAGWQEVALPK